MTKNKNAVFVCHALTGDPDLTNWWEGLFGAGKALDPSRDFIVCANAPGSPYGSVSPLTADPATGESYGADFRPSPFATSNDTFMLIFSSSTSPSVPDASIRSEGVMHLYLAGVEM